LVLSLVLAPLAGCDSSTPHFWQPANDLLPMVALGDRVAYVEKSSHTAFLLDPADTSLKPRMVPVGTAPATAVKHNGSNQMLVLSYGESGSASIKPIPPQLEIIEGNASVAPAIYPLTSRFDSLAQSQDGRFVILYHSSASQNASDTGLFNPNEMTIVDFTPPTHPTVPTLTAKSIRSLGGVPTRIEFSPPYPFKAGSRSLAVVLSQSYVTILDLDNADRTEISVPLCPQSTGCTYSPDQILFDPANAAIYVRAGNAMDIFQIALTDLGAAPTDGSNDFLASLSMLSVGANPASMVLYGSGPDTRLAVLAPSNKRLVIIDPSTSHTLSIATSIPANVMVPFTAVGAAGAPQKQAMLVDTINGSTSVLFADLEEVETISGLAIKDAPLRAAASDVQPLVDQGIAVLVLGKYGAISAFTVVEFGMTSKFVEITVDSTFGNPYFEMRNPSRLWGVDSGTRLSYLNLVARGAKAALVSSVVSLDQTITSIQALEQASADGHRYLVVGQSDPNQIGNLTFLDADNPDRPTARTAYGFLFSNYLERGQP
jgi:hypothetical protein